MLPSLMGVYCEDEREADSAAAHAAGPAGNSSLPVIVPEEPVALAALQLLSGLNCSPSLCLGSFTFKTEMITIIPTSLACGED